MITSNIKISLDSDTATQVALDTNFTYDVGFNLPMPRLSKLELLGINGDVDITNALGAATYGNRVVNMSLAVKNSTANGDTVCDSFINTYDGENVRLYIGSSYFLRGRLTVIGDNRADALRQLSVTINAEPLRCSTTYTPSASGLDITPENLGANLWSSANVTPPYPETHVTASGASIDADADDSDGVAFEVNDTVVGSGKLLRIYTQNINNCKVMIVEYDGENERIVVSEATGTALYMSNGNRLIIKVFRKNTSSAASFGCTIREIATHTVNNAGKAIPFEIKNTFYSNTTAKTKIYANGTVFAPKQMLSGAWQEYAPAVLKSGNNIIAAFVDSGSYDSTQSGGELRIRYRKGVL